MLEQIFASGKTKELSLLSGSPGLCKIRNLDNMTWDDTHSVIVPGKGVWATTTTCNVFALLKASGIPVAYKGHLSETNCFAGDICSMIPVEVIVRFANEGNSSYSKRYPDAPLGPFPSPVVEFNLKTVKKLFGSDVLLFDDPLISKYMWLGMFVHNPKEAVFAGQGEFVRYTHIFGQDPMSIFGTMQQLALTIATVLKEAWAKIGWNLGDLKIEFGILPDGSIVLGDVIDNDSWRLQDSHGIERSKQTVRNDGYVSEQTIRSYSMVAEASARLRK